MARVREAAARPGLELPAVERAGDGRAFHAAFAQRAALVGAGVVEREDALLGTDQGERGRTRRDLAHRTRLHRGGLRHRDPLARFRRVGKLDPDLAVLQLHRVHTLVRALLGQHASGLAVDLPAVQRACDRLPFHHALRQRATRVWARVVEGEQAFRGADQRQIPSFRAHESRPFGTEILGLACGDPHRSFPIGKACAMAAGRRWPWAAICLSLREMKRRAAISERGGVLHRSDKDGSAARPGRQTRRVREPQGKWQNVRFVESHNPVSVPRAHRRCSSNGTSA